MQFWMSPCDSVFVLRKLTINSVSLATAYAASAPTAYAGVPTTQKSLFLSLFAPT